MRPARARGGDSEAAIDLTPMLDIVFIMLIFFIVTTAFVKETGVEVQRPSAQSAVQQEGGNILIAIRPNGEVWMEKKRVDFKAVRANVERMLAEAPESAVVVLADAESNTGVLVEVMDQAKLAGAPSISIAAEQGSR